MKARARSGRLFSPGLEAQRTVLARAGLGSPAYFVRTMGFQARWSHNPIYDCLPSPLNQLPTN